MDIQIPADQRKRVLDDLTTALTASGVVATLKIPIGEAPYVTVVSPVDEHMNEKITVEDIDGRPWFFWSWGDRIVPVVNTEGAVRSIRHVIGAAELIGRTAS